MKLNDSITPTLGAGVFCGGIEAQTKIINTILQRSIDLSHSTIELSDYTSAWIAFILGGGAMAGYIARDYLKNRKQKVKEKK